MRRWIQVLLSTLGAAAAAFLFVHLLMAPPGDGTAELSLKLEVRGLGDKPVSDAMISLYTPTKRRLGYTTAQGTFQGLWRVPQGKVTTLEVEGPAFRIRKEILVPRSKFYQVTLTIDPSEVELGNIDLISRNLERTSRRIADAVTETPTPQAAEAKPQAAGAKPQATPHAPVAKLAATPRPARTPIWQLSPQRREQVRQTLARELPKQTKAVQAVPLSPKTSAIPAFTLALKADAGVPTRPEWETLRSYMQKQVVDAVGDALRSKGVTAVELRPVGGGSAHYEFLARQGSEVKGAFLFASSERNPELLKRRARRMWLIDVPGAGAARDPRPKVLLSGAAGNEPRVYLNGLPVPRARGKTQTLFFLGDGAGRLPATRSQHHILATADGRPVLQRNFARLEKAQVIRWSLDPTALSKADARAQ